MTPALRALAAVLPVAVLSACSPQSAQAAPQTARGVSVDVDTSDRAAIEAVVRDYLIAHPEVVEEALVALSEKRMAENAAKLASDPRDFSIGPVDAKVTIVEFFDYRCGYCKRSMDWVLATARENPEDVRVVFKEFPILSAESRTASLAALAAGRQGKYNAMHQALMASKSDFSDAAIDEVAKSVGVDVKRMRADMKTKEILQHVSDVRDGALAVGAEATPTFFINGRVVAGYDVATLDRFIAEELAKAG
jgi:protein-disulfide isomerase